MEIIYIVGAFVFGVIFHASAAALWEKWYPKVKDEVASAINKNPPV